MRIEITETAFIRESPRPWDKLTADPGHTRGFSTHLDDFGTS